MQISKRAISALAHAATEDEDGRPVLAAIAFDGKGKAFAANGFVILATEVDQGEQESPVLVSATTLVAVSELAGVGSSYVRISAKDRECELRCRQGSHTMLVRTEQITGSAPNYESVLPAHRTLTEGATVIYLNPRLLQSIVSAADDIGATMIRLQIGEPDKPVRVDFGEMSGGIMPMMGPEVAEWTKAKQTESKATA